MCKIRKHTEKQPEHVEYKKKKKKETKKTFTQSKRVTKLLFVISSS